MATKEDAGQKQLRLFPTEIVWVAPPTGPKTADCRLFGRGADGCDYAIKDATSHPLVPHSEWFCTKLGELVGIAAPPCVIAKMPDDSLVFASRWEGGIVDQWWSRIGSGEINQQYMSDVLSKIYAFDQFISNIDRHANNFLVRQQRTDLVFFAFDYSKAWLWSGAELPPAPLPQATRTVTMQRQLSNQIGKYINPSKSEEVINKIREIDNTEIEIILNTHPYSWLPKDKREYILDWWNSSGRHNRLDLIERGIADGSYL